LVGEDGDEAEADVRRMGAYKNVGLLIRGRAENKTFREGRKNMQSDIGNVVTGAMIPAKLVAQVAGSGW
jgi:hypothetical protein